ncbi:hypothetical protein XI05_38000 [Bradyrhizobium sp. CCBAU 11357]|nr:hypothetical protein [Bradyrhizobium sp. CCBAU 11357]
MSSKRAGRLECALVGAGDLGGIAPGVVVRAKGSLLVTTLLQPTGFLLGEFLGYCRLSPQYRMMSDLNRKLLGGAK